MILLSVLVLVAGLVIYGLSNAKASAVGLHMFWVGLLVFLLHGDQVVTLLHSAR